MDIDRKAPVITQDGIAIAAPLSFVWKLHTDIAAWPTWNMTIGHASIDSPLAVGAVFRWSTAGLEMISTVLDLVTQERIGCTYGNAEIASGLTEFWLQSSLAISADQQPYAPQPVASTCSVVVSPTT